MLSYVLDAAPPTDVGPHQVPSRAARVDSELPPLGDQSAFTCCVRDGSPIAANLKLMTRSQAEPAR